MTIGEKIRTLRQDNHMTQEALAGRLNISPQAVSKWEQNVTAPDISLLRDISGCFQVTTDELLGVGKYKTASGYKTYRQRLRRSMRKAALRRTSSGQSPHTTMYCFMGCQPARIT